MDSLTEDLVLFDTWMKGDTAGFAALYDRYKNRVFGFLVRMTGDREIAEDLCRTPLWRQCAMRSSSTARGIS
jgi:hypothetical protein